MRNYEGMKLGAHVGQNTRLLMDELAKIDKWARQASIAMNALHSTNYPAAKVYVGGGFSSGNLAIHDHHNNDNGGRTLRNIQVEPYVLASGNAMTIKGLSGQTGDLVKVLDSAASLICRITSSGAVTSNYAGTPQGRFHAEALSGDDRGLYIGQNETSAFNKPCRGLEITQYITDGSANYTTAARGIHVTQSSLQTYSAECRGISVDVTNTGYNDDSDTASAVKGLSFAVQSAAGNTYNCGNFYGLEGVAKHGGTKTMTSLTGGLLAVATVGTGTVTNAYGLNVKNTPSSGSTWSDYRGVMVQNPANSGTTTNWYGVYVDGTANSNVTNKWAIYTSKACPVYFRGKLGVNKTAPGAMAQIDSDASGTVGAIINNYTASSVDILQCQVAGTTKASVSNAGKITGTHAGTTTGTVVLNLGSTADTGKTANWGPSTLLTSTPQAGMYRISAYAECTTAGTGGTLDMTFSWTDNIGTASDTGMSGAAGLPLSTTGHKSYHLPIRATNAAQVSYSAAFTGATGSPVVNLYLTIEGI